MGWYKNVIFMDIILSFVVYDSLLYDIDGILTMIHISMSLMGILKYSYDKIFIVLCFDIKQYMYKHAYSSELGIRNIISCYCHYAEERKLNELRVHNSFFVATSS